MRLQTRGAQEPSWQEALALQRLVAEAEAAHEDSQREVGAQHLGLPSGQSGTVRGAWLPPPRPGHLPMGGGGCVYSPFAHEYSEAPHPTAEGHPGGWGTGQTTGRVCSSRQGIRIRRDRVDAAEARLGQGGPVRPRGCTTERRERTVAQREVRGDGSWLGAGGLGGSSEVSGRRGGLATGSRALTGQPSACPLFTPLGAHGGGPGLSTTAGEPWQTGLGLAPRRPRSGQPLAIALSGQGRVAASQALCCLPGPAGGPGVLPPPGLRGPCCQKCAGRQVQSPPAATPKGGREAETPGKSRQVWSPHTPPTGPEAAAAAGGGGGPG